MKNIFKITGLLALTFIISCYQEADKKTEDFFRAAPGIPANYQNGMIYPQGSVFPYSGFSPDARALQESFTMAGPAYTGNDALLKQSEIAGKKTIFLLKAENVSHEMLEKEKDAAFEKIAESIRKQVSAVADNTTIAWWYITPEELRPWKANEMTYLETVAAAVKANDPLKRPVWMYDPGHRNASALASTCKFLDICGKGMYPNYSGFKDSRIFCRWTIEQETEAIQSSNPTAIPIAVPEMFQEPDPENTDTIKSWVRHDVYSSLIAGAKGIVVFSFGNRKGFKSRDIYFNEYAKTAEELCGQLNLGQVFLFGEKRNDISLEITEGPEKLRFFFKNAGMKDPVEYPSLNIFNAAFGNERYLFMVSSANSWINARIKGFPAKVAIYDIFNKKDMDISDKDFMEITFEPLEVKAFRFSKGKGGTK